jgi:hypothetical protein
MLFIIFIIISVITLITGIPTGILFYFLFAIQ